ncbi:DEHA2F15026p [Debaryomyces hansenii CBS767]|jgi:hypothetical protein|uniref:DEHA2F15026p n=1 Tax=Debaryomyces hansenii (strain ATCC 36239 / CBS 767 / BCRC 21394 / JCM 1990 / NBRC 0083 / IGC 2968) TaxID=284592 RepID=Q6BLA8_DEBHA|nr:DEHA2F15026p [Debaryomyces hansenii CBS767]CAG89383.1 DEHA2F15026p [Debaryomyces hansenii CBS767]|eukprot:XP_461013.1 DEHA2F15026p [Debaryomyces hansenii CBS767]
MSSIELVGEQQVLRKPMTAKNLARGVRSNEIFQSIYSFTMYDITILADISLVP